MTLKIRMVCLEDGIMSCGFRKMAAWVERLNPDTTAHYVSSNHFGGMRYLLGRLGESPDLDDASVDDIARSLADADLVGLSCMTGYAPMARAVIRRLRELGSKTYIVWGGIHPIIHPEDAIASQVNAICTGEGEFAFEEFLDAFRGGRDFTSVANFWFSEGGKIIRNGFRPLQTAAEMESLPFPKYGGVEWIYRKRSGFVRVGVRDYLQTNGLGYNMIWSIGCPFKCSYCGNTKFIANDPNYRKIRHPSARYCVDEVKAALRAMPHVSQVSFHDDSFLALPYDVLAEFSELWHDELGLPFAVYGVIPTYVRKDKLEILTWAGLNRIRMGIQTGSERLLEFYKRPTPLDRIDEATEVCASFAPRYHIPPSYDMITDNPVETREDVLETLELIYRLARPFTLNLFSLKVIPNTTLEQIMRERGIDIDAISSSYRNIPPKWANLLLYLLTIWRPPRWLFDRLLEGVEGTATPQPEYPRLALALRTAFFAKRAVEHLAFADFSAIQGPVGWAAWKSGAIAVHRKFAQRPPRPAPPPPKAAPSKQVDARSMLLRSSPKPN